MVSLRISESLPTLTDQNTLEVTSFCPRNMIAQVLLAALVLGLAAAQQTFVFHTNGTGGVECGKYHRCSTNATCENIKGTHMCECPHWLEGNAKIFCLPHPDHKVWIQSDPHMKNFHNEFASLRSPCRYKVLYLYITDPEKDLIAEVELFGENFLFTGGDYFLTNLTLSTRIFYGTEFMRQAMGFEGNVMKDVDGEGYSYLLVAKSVEMEFSDESDSESKSDIVPEESPLLLYTMDVEEDVLDNLLTVKIYGLGISIYFRPPSKGEGLNNLQLPLVPGAVFSIDDTHMKKVNIEKSQYNLAAWPQGPSLADLAKSLKVSKPVYIQYLMLNNSLPIIPVLDPEPICHEIDTSFQEKCNSTEIQLYMLKTCPSIYADKTFLECLTEKNTEEEYVSAQREFFLDCELSLCLKDAKACEEMKKDMPIRTKCPLPKKIEELDCSSLG
ncbi:hypothetical protein PoB_002384400 [Plakobranchus ocellatus]|uniref:EGF-like domain-containing protein n=1 Tax=Plakobranchus ocellatus TaxID=259542 RepID=A0AAV3ZSF9_9GAST|nr:hypothetical protein PoB_002384400 [Plakobranchus ocellatus]